MRMLRMAVVGLAVMLAASLTYAAEAGGKAAGEGRGADGMRGGMGGGMLMGMSMVQSDASKAEMERHRKAMESLQQELKALHDAIKKDVDGGTAAKDAEQKHMDEAKALAKKFISEQTMFLTNMAKVMQDDGATAVDKMAERLLKPPQPGLRGNRGGDARPEAGGRPEGGRKRHRGGDNPPQPPPPGDNPKPE